MTDIGMWLVIAALAVACGGGSEGGGGAAGGSSSGEPAPSAAAASELFEGLETKLDLVATAHLADIDDGGVFIDFGTPQRDKYTNGDFRTGWIGDGTEGTTTFTTVGETGRVYFHVDEPGALTLRFRVKPVGTGVMSLFINNDQLETVRMDQGAGFQERDVAVPAEHVVRGENYLLLRFGGSTQVGNDRVSVAMDSLRVFRGPVPATVTPPTEFGELLSEVTLDGAARRSVGIRRGATMTWYVQVQPGAKLGFVGGSGQGDAPTRITIRPEGADAPTELWSGTLGARWTEALVDLAPYAGKIARISVEPSAGAGRISVAKADLLVQRRGEQEAPRRAKNVVVLVIDTMRADKLRPWNPRTRVRTPVLDGVATEGAVFARAHSPENWTKPSVASILTALFPATHGAKTSEARVPAGALLLSEHLKANGLQTSSFIANGYVSDRFGFDQGWDHYTNYIRERKPSDAANVFGEAARWIEANRERPFFTFIQTIDPHVPYDPPAEFLAMYDARTDYAGVVRPRNTAEQLEHAKRNPPLLTFDASDRQRLEALYDGEVSYHDRELGRFIEKLRELGVWEDTLFVVTSDHGEEFNEHGSWGHGHSVYEELLHVPLLFRGPGVPRELRVTDTVGTLDIAPTVLALLGKPPMPHAEGRNLAEYLRGGVIAGPRVAFSDFLDDRRVITAGHYKLIMRGTNPTVFDLDADPGEQRELPVGRLPIAMRYMRIHLGQFVGATNRAFWLSAQQGNGATFTTENAEMDGEIREQLGALGYVN